MLVFLLPLILINNSTGITSSLRSQLTYAWVILWALDIVDIMFHLNKDERDRLHEAYAERNAMWVIVALLAAGVLYQAAISVQGASFQVDPVIIVALFGGVAAKAITNLYLRDK